MLTILSSIAIERDHTVAELDGPQGLLFADPGTDHEARIEEDVWTEYQSRVDVGDISAAEAEVQFFKWRNVRLGKLPVDEATQRELHQPMPREVAKIERTLYFAPEYTQYKLQSSHAA